MRDVVLLDPRENGARPAEDGEGAELDEIEETELGV